MLLRLSDWAFIGLGISLLFLDTSIDGLIALTGLLPLFWVGVRSAIADVPRVYVVSTTFLVQLCVLLALIAVLNPPPSGTVAFEHAAYPTFWGANVGLIILISVRLAIVEDIVQVTDRILPWVLVACFIGLSIDKFSGEIGGAECRVRGLTRWPFTPALFFTVFTLFSFASWPKLNASGQYVRLGLVTAAVLLANGYAGVRMIAIVQLVCFVGFAFLFWWARPAGLPRPALKIMIAVGLGLIMSVIVDFVSGCQLFLRFGELATAAFDPEALQQGSGVALRLQFLRHGLDAVALAPWLGYGIWAEELLVEGSGHTHVHNQYLSWLVWGGLPVLVSGLLFLAAPLVAIVGVKDRWRRAVLIATVVGPMPLSLTADTFLRLPTFLNLQLFISCLVIAVAIKSPRSHGVSPDASERTVIADAPKH